MPDRILAREYVGRLFAREPVRKTTLASTYVGIRSMIY